MAGFEPAAPRSQAECAAQTALHPDKLAEREGFEPPTPGGVVVFGTTGISLTRPTLRDLSGVSRALTGPASLSRRCTTEVFKTPVTAKLWWILRESKP
jgi:hypothetical protein